MSHSIDAVRESFRYDCWANRRVLDALRGAPGAEGAVRTFAHILGAKRTWMSRMLHGLDAINFEIWPTLSLDECEALMGEVEHDYAAFLDELDADGLARVAVYRNSRGEEFQTSIDDILRHVGFHSAYHRGQIASAVRASGALPPVADYIVYVRERGNES